MKKHLTAVTLLTIAVLLLGGQVCSHEGDNVGAFMRAKLKHSQNVLEGLTTEDFEMISKGAAQLEILSQEASWQVLQTLEYRQQSLEFRRSVKALKDQADKENMDGAALAYVDVTLNCVRCHQYVRSVRNASFDDGL